MGVGSRSGRNPQGLPYLLLKSLVDVNGAAVDGRHGNSRATRRMEGSALQLDLAGDS